MLMLKARHSWSDTSFNDLLRILASTYLEGNKVPANTYRAKRNASCRADADDERGPKKKKTTKKSTAKKQILSLEDEEEEGYT